jgi:hypothetical protein
MQPLIPPESGRCDIDPQLQVRLGTHIIQRPGRGALRRLSAGGWTRDAGHFPGTYMGQVSTEVAKGTPEDEQESDNERHVEGDPQPSLAWLAADHTDNPGSYNPNASHTQEDQERYVLRHRNEPGLGTLAADRASKAETAAERSLSRPCPSSHRALEGPARVTPSGGQRLERRSP